MPLMPTKMKRREIDVAMVQLGERIAQIRKKRGLTQMQLAHTIGVSQNLISTYEGGTVRLGTDMAVKIAKALKVTADDLLGLKQEDGRESLPSSRILRRLARFDTLPRRKQDALLQTIDAVLQSADG